MAMMSFPREWPVDASRLVTLALGVEAVDEWAETANGRRPTGDQATHEDSGLPLWQVGVMFNDATTGDATGSAVVQIAAETKPEVVPGQPIEFEGLAVSVWSGRSGLGGRLEANGIVISGKASKRQPAPPAPTEAAA